jgi:hypothetical protein
VNQWVKKYPPGKKPQVPTPINLESDNTILIAQADSQVLLVTLDREILGLNETSLTIKEEKYGNSWRNSLHTDQNYGSFYFRRISNSTEEL